MNKLTMIALGLGALGLGVFIVLNDRLNVSQHRSSSGAQSNFTSLSTIQTRTGASNDVNPIVLSELPEHIQPLFREYQYAMTYSVARKITPADKDLLLKLYRQEPDLLKKRSLTTALGFVGDEEVVEEFKHTLSDRYAGRKLSAGNGDDANRTDEELAMSLTVTTLGFLANKSDSAYEFLKKGVDPGFWKDYCKFIPATGVAFYGNLAGDAIVAVGMSGRPEATNFLVSLKDQPLVNYLDTSIMQESYFSAVFDSAYFNDMYAQHGLEYVKRLYFDLELSLQNLHEWKQNGIGLEWDNWYIKRMKE